MIEPKIAVSVVMCTHNPRQVYINRAIAALKSQTLPTSAWELIVIDNRSDPSIDGQIELSWKPGARILREETLGLTPARLRGIQEAQGELLVFVDDDNVLDPDYLGQAIRIAEDHPYLGSWSGQCVGEFEETPPEWTRRYWGNLCIRVFDKPLWSNLPRLPETMPAGAGMCVRREVCLEYLELHHRGMRAFQLDRTGNSLISGGDNDLAACACRLELGLGVFPQLRLLHLIPPERLTSDYLQRLVEGIAFSATLLDAQWGLYLPRRGGWGRLLDSLRVMRLRSPDREILAAFYKGRNDAVRVLSRK